MNWDDLKYVLETVRHGGTSGAARALGVNHATVARRIAAAEAALGARLFDRLPGGYVPTEAGFDAVATAEEMAALQHRLDRRIGARDTALQGRLCITAPELLFQRILAPICADFIAQHPEIDLQLLATNENVNMAQRTADVAFRFSANPPEALVGRRVLATQASVYAHRDLIAQDPGGTAPLDWVRFAHWPGPPPEVTEVRPNLRQRFTVDDMTAAIGAARAKIGATRMACFLGDTDPVLARVPGMPLFPFRPLWVLTHEDLRQVPRIRVFMEFAVQRLVALRPLFEGHSAS
ncbi:LysR family transcriptional regulator [Cognatishimia sp. SS12]|uniref:LysR family transcriptional regulator n=1 Tax=Cognatishimia sp. SS12 TaxID=2979465 RepID=UPI00232BE462|nr:LysR family transcriptional regulator [Cognatishimia sp. SS12]